VIFHKVVKHWEQTAAFQKERVQLSSIDKHVTIISDIATAETRVLESPFLKTNHNGMQKNMWACLPQWTLNKVLKEALDWLVWRRLLRLHIKPLEVESRQGMTKQQI
jgi:hypothetical protein